MFNIHDINFFKISWINKYIKLITLGLGFSEKLETNRLLLCTL
jgi:hypothetical protein